MTATMTPAPPTTSQENHRVPWRHRQGAWWASPALLYVPALALMVPVFVIPTLVMLSLSFTSEPGGLHWYVQAFQSDLVRAVLIRSFAIAFTVTAISLLIGLPYAAIARRAPRPIANVLYGAIAASLFFSVIVRAYAWLSILGHGGPVQLALQWLGIDTDGLRLVNSPFGVVVGMVQYGVPFMVLAIADVMRRTDDNLERAAATLGSGPVHRWIHVKLPMLKPGIVAGVTIVFVTTLGYYIIPAILGSPREMMIGELIGSQVGTTLNWGYGSALASILLVLTGLALWLLNLLGRK
ncbi:ABC transporter permease [Sediminivirga luteola]|uniref:ABC transmembrane type-1 domain-containing protein n=1 Tax=Sediminivirga luteola TaxID=1774748 RepID=A0A8J2XJY9_9MICO|nr:ABC transporter permease [Sediminivirga luteola]MCI2264312.1 ABC transporter permease [Sediminivirga luteola]GGA05263.1 hypothetical protein GCM10011333_05100 [Sediminivirga luteola]